MDYACRTDRLCYAPLGLSFFQSASSMAVALVMAVCFRLKQKIHRYRRIDGVSVDISMLYDMNCSVSAVPASSGKSHG